MIGNKRQAPYSSLYGAFLRAGMQWFYLSWRNECDMIPLSVEFVIHMEEHFGREQSG